MEKFNIKNRILIGITLFSMFFGAGNLIFPPFLGAQAGKSMPAALIGFGLSAVVLPVLGVVAVTRSGGLYKLASRVHPKFAFVYIMILYLAIGPCLAIPRTASTSFSMAVTPFFDGSWLPVFQLVYTIIFFFAALIVAMHPEKLTEYLGKRLTPILLILITAVFFVCLLGGANHIAVPVPAYSEGAVVKGFLDGYQTMDTLAALNFGMIIVMNIRAKGVEKEQFVTRETIHAGWIAGAVLLSVYAMLAFVGMSSSGVFAGASNGTETLTAMVSLLFGKTGAVILAVIFVIACFNTCVGLFSCCGKYFNSVFPKISYKSWVFMFAAVSAVIANVGLDAILKFSVPVLNAIYPIAILLIIFSCLQKWIADCRSAHVGAVTIGGIASIIAVLDGLEITIPVLTPLMQNIPFYKAGFGWIIPSAAGLFAGLVIDRLCRKRRI